MDATVAYLTGIIQFVAPDIIRFKDGYQPEDCHKLQELARAYACKATPVIEPGYWKIEEPLIELLKAKKTLMA